MSKRPPIKVYEEADHLRFVLKHNTAISLRYLKIIKGREGAIYSPLSLLLPGGQQVLLLA
jgi:hypothetical protein